MFITPRVETVSYFLKRYRKDMARNKQRQADVDAKMREFEAKLRAELDTAMPTQPATGAVRDGNARGHQCHPAGPAGRVIGGGG